MHLRPIDPVLRGADELVTREPPSAVALATVLERSRASLVRGDAADALAALDDASEGATRSESGWYLRCAALTLLGHPGEAERVLRQALVPRGGSVALLFLQSMVRSALGDTAGSRESLLGAEARRPEEPALIAWRAVLTARAGDRSGALQQLSKIPAAQGHAALLGWARQSIAAASADASERSPLLSAMLAPVEANPRLIGAHTPLHNPSRLLDTLLTPICVGLSLLQQPSSRAEAPRSASQPHAPGTAPMPPIEDRSSPTYTTAAEQPLPAVYGQTMALPGASASVRGRGRSGEDRASPSLSESFRSGQRMRALALVCMALAFAAMVYGWGVAAIALAGGASWLALRSSSVSAAAHAREQDTPVESPR